MDKYKYTKEVDGRTLTLYDETRFLKDKGALTEDGRVVVPILEWDENGKPTRYGEPPYVKYQEQIEGWYKRDFAEKQRLEQLEQTL